MLGRRRLLASLSLLPLARWPYAHAHRLNYSLTELHWRVDRRALEVTHALHLDDALVLLATLDDPRAELSVRAQARLLLYVARHFALFVADKNLLLEPVGAQIDGDYLWIYQEVALTQWPQNLQVHCTLLHELFADQQNQVTLRVGETLSTQLFDAQRTVAVMQ